MGRKAPSDRDARGGVFGASPGEWHRARCAQARRQRVDAAAAVGFALTVLMPQQNGLGGEVPILLSRGGSAQIEALSGDAIAPRAATLEYFQNLSVELIPFDGLLPALVPPAPATWLFLLERYGSLRLADVLEPALDLAEHGFPDLRRPQQRIALQAPRFRQEWPSSAANSCWMAGHRVWARFGSNRRSHARFAG